LGHLLQLDFPFFLYFLQHFFFFPPQLTSQSMALQGEYKDGINKVQKYKKKIPKKGIFRFSRVTY